jgi:hypothetical protein
MCLGAGEIRHPAATHFLPRFSVSALTIPFKRSKCGANSTSLLAHTDCAPTITSAANGLSTVLAYQTYKADSAYLWKRHHPLASSFCSPRTVELGPRLRFAASTHFITDSAPVIMSACASCAPETPTELGRAPAHRFRGSGVAFLLRPCVFARWNKRTRYFRTLDHSCFLLQPSARWRSMNRSRG